MADGTAIAIISPFNAVDIGFAANAPSLSFLQVASASTTTPYSAGSFAPSIGPFNSQVANFVNYGIDFCRIRYINT